MAIGQETGQIDSLHLLSNQYDALLEQTDHMSPLALYGKAKVLERLAELEKANSVLERAIHFYREVLFLGPAVPDGLYRLAGEHCSKLLQFRGWPSKAIRVQQMLVTRLDNDPQPRRQLGVLYLTVGKNQEAEIVFDELLQKYPGDKYAMAHLGFIVKSRALDKNDMAGVERAVDLMQAGIDGVPQEGLFYFHLGDGLRRLGRSAEADGVYQKAVDNKIFPSFWQRSLYNVDGLKAQPVWTLKDTGIGSELEKLKRNWKVIREEALSVLSSGGFAAETENLRDSGKWAQFDLFVRGRKLDDHCALAPVTCSLIETIPLVSTNKRGQVKFSVMYAGTHVHAHTGPTNCRLRAHLGLKVPRSNSTEAAQSSTRLRVADKYLTWAEGEVFVFDDSFDHEVWHDNVQKEERVILIFDLWHPELDTEQKMTLPAI